MTTFKVVIPLNPVPASRPRVTKWGAYYGKNYTAWKKAAEEYLLGLELTPLEGPLHVLTIHAIQKPKTSKREWPRGDLDNYNKATWDACTKGNVWQDDDQIVSEESWKWFVGEGEQPHTTIICKPPEAVNIRDLGIY